jgi:hypothetical protein
MANSQLFSLNSKRSEGCAYKPQSATSIREFDRKVWTKESDWTIRQAFVCVYYCCKSSGDAGGVSERKSPIIAVRPGLIWRTPAFRRRIEAG